METRDDLLKSVTNIETQIRIHEGKAPVAASATWLVYCLETFRKYLEVLNSFHNRFTKLESQMKETTGKISDLKKWKEEQEKEMRKWTKQP